MNLQLAAISSSLSVVPTVHRLQLAEFENVISRNAILHSLYFKMIKIICEFILQSNYYYYYYISLLFFTSYFVSF